MNHSFLQEVYERCVASLNAQLYARPCEDLRAERRKGTQGSHVALHAECPRVWFGIRQCDFPLLLQASESDWPKCDENGLPLDYLTKTSPPVQRFAVLCDTLGALGKLDDALAECRQRTRAGLWHCVQSALKEIEKTHGKGKYAADSATDRNTIAVKGDAEENTRLVEALQLMIQLFDTVITLHAIMLRQASRVAVAYNVRNTTVIHTVVFNEIQVHEC